ncbi:ribosome biogenesis GTPase YlqF [Clostridium fermenticellae]|uniref:Ribosome biogenesis GTPase A n=1 Tax=Clostridium fermenticellae TaxID=2068654 RepID=A0A386H2Z5_9CLOT|nr:ribosome biogenesis GTPase YlqF [Clostridium fermenticellae]AYD40050.1 ribosome biogenesis GTPase YlqF [Clostridium fermenticellae]
MVINWFPGHMAKTKRELKESLKLVDAVIEIRDARIVKSSENPDINDICEGKPRIILLNKSDLSAPLITKGWIKCLSNNNVKTISANCVTGDGLKSIKSLLNELLKDKHDRAKQRGIAKIVDRVMVVGIPNVGKSSFINRIAKSKNAKTGDRPGVTKSKQWIRTKIGIELMDTPGILWPKLEKPETQLNLAFTGAIKDEILDTEELALKLIERLMEDYPSNLMIRYKLNELYDDPLKNMEAIALKRGAVLSGHNIDYTRVSTIILDEFRGGKLGKISLERP